MPPQPYGLLGSLEPRSEGDVKTVVAVHDSHFASASRDTSVKLWARTSAGSEESEGYFQLRALFGGHGAYVNSLAHIPGGEKLGFLASGGISTMILIHNVDTLSPEAEHCLIGHTSNVCALRYSSAKQQLISGSWDRTARVWTNASSEWKYQLTLDDHDQAVWDVLVLEQGLHEGSFLTGSADCAIRLWSSDGELLQRFKGCPEPVRSLTLLLGQQEFASASNDGVVRIWDLEGRILAKLEGHTDYVYHVEWGRNKRLLSCGEDKTVRVWDAQGNLEATLVHPCTSVWSATSFDDDIIVSAGSDGFIRVWGKGAADSAVSSEQQPESDADDGKEPGTEDADTTNTRPEKVNTEQANEASAHTRMVIDIDYADDQPPVQCIHDRDADPCSTAEEFVREHNLSEAYIDRIAEFIRGHM